MKSFEKEEEVIGGIFLTDIYIYIYIASSKDN